MCEYKELPILEVEIANATSTPSATSRDTTSETTSKGEDTPNCPICQETTQDSYLVRRFHCGHLVHQNCLKAVTQRCPVCRADLTGEMMLCHDCYAPIKTVFYHNARVHQLCDKCFRDFLSEELERSKKTMVNLYRHSIAMDKEAFNIQVAMDMEGLDAEDAFKQLKSLQESFSSTVLVLSN
jgi:hypothetical protein